MAAVKRRVCFAALLFSCGTAAWAQTQERIVWGQVTRIEPITSTMSTPPDVFCAGPKPAAPTLTEMLAWDLHASCHEQTRTETLGYRVSYSWDGRHYTINTEEHPGDRIALRLRLR